MARKKKARKTDDASPAEVIIDLETTLGIADAARFYQKLAAALEEKREVVFDASRVEMAGTAMLQMLVAFMQAMRDRCLGYSRQTEVYAQRVVGARALR